MKFTFVSLFISFFFGINMMFAQVTPFNQDTVEAIKEFRNLYRYENFYISGQPSYEAMRWLKNKGVITIINLRTAKENQDFAEASFNEDSAARQMGFKYYSIPVDGTKDYTPAKLDQMSNLLAEDKPVLIHCTSANRATYFFMAYLIKNRSYSIDKAIEIGKKLTFSFPLENLLNTRITMDVTPDKM
jgi:uncharacterized protein (TIGR01244 family)